jgi:hypothetical protein
MKFSFNSGLLHVVQPCCYWEFQDYLNDLETREVEYTVEQANERIDLFEEGQPWLAGLADTGFVKGKLAYRTVLRKDLPKDHPEYAGEMVCELDGDAARRVIAECWLDTLEAWMDELAGYEGRKRKIKVSFTGTTSPREYNWRHDSCEFTLSIPKAELSRIVRLCLQEHREEFQVYLREAYQNRDGFWSYLSKWVEDYDRYWNMLCGKEPKNAWEKPEHVVWACLDFWLFGMAGHGRETEDTLVVRWEKNQEQFRANLWDKVYDAEGNGAFQKGMTFTPVTESGAA